MSYKDSLGLPASPSLHNVWAGYSCSASLRGLLIQTVHIMQKLRPSRHYGNSHPNTDSNAYLFHSLVQILHLFWSPLFQMISQCLRLSLWNLFCTWKGQGISYCVQNNRKKESRGHTFTPGFHQGKSKLEEISELCERSSSLTQMYMKKYCRLDIALQSAHLLQICSLLHPEEKQKGFLLLYIIEMQHDMKRL